MVQYYTLYIALSHYLYYSKQKKKDVEKKNENPKLGLGLSFCLRKKGGEEDERKWSLEGVI